MQSQWGLHRLAVDYCKARISWQEREVLAVLFLDNQHKLIKAEKLFFGTINQAIIYPREIVKEARLCNAAAIIISHNHPSGECKPSEADFTMTRKIEKACNLMDIRLLDHIIVSPKEYHSFREQEQITDQQQKLFR